VRVTTPGAPSPAADVLLNQDFLIWGIGPPAASVGVLVAGLLARRSSPSVGRLMLLVGVIGLVLSAARLAFAFYVDAVLGDT
jgi:hypothetical protein